MMEVITQQLSTCPRRKVATDMIDLVEHYKTVH